MNPIHHYRTSQVRELEESRRQLIIDAQQHCAVKDLPKLLHVSEIGLHALNGDKGGGVLQDVRVLVTSRDSMLKQLLS